MHPGTRNYYFLVKRESIEASKQEVTEDDLAIANVEEELTTKDCEEFPKDGINIRAT